MFTKDLSFTHHEITSPSWLLALTALRKKNEDRKWAELVPLTVCEQRTKHQIACSTSKEQLCVIQESTPTFDLTPLCLSTIVTVQFLIFSCPQSTIPVTPECTAHRELRGKSEKHDTRPKLPDDTVQNQASWRCLWKWERQWSHSLCASSVKRLP